MRIWFALVTTGLAAQAEHPAPEPLRTAIEKSCAGCHRSATAPAGLDLTALNFDLKDTHTRSRWVRVHDAVQQRKMPPGGMPDAARASLLASLAAPITDFEQTRAAQQGRSVLRRLNRYEYENTLRVLLAAPWLQLRDSLPEDGIVDRFNKVGQALDISHVQMARYLEAAEQALRTVLAASKQPPSTERFYARDQKTMQHRMRFSPFNRHAERASIPILGFDAQPEVLAEKVPFSVGSADPKTRELEGFAFSAGTYVGNEYHFDRFTAPAGGRYQLRFNAFSLWVHTLYEAGERGDKLVYWRPNRQKTSKGRTLEPLTIYALSTGGEKRLLGTLDLGPEPAIHELDAYLLPGEKILTDPARLFRSRPGFRGSPHATPEGMPGVAYRWLEVSGPQPDPSNARILGRYFDARSGVDRSIRTFLQDAFRRPVSDTEAQPYIRIAKARLAAKEDPTEAFIAAYTAALCSPGFLYLREEPGRLDSYALASRLSYFLWNAPPDEKLLTDAASGRLARAGVVDGHVNRLLDSPRSSVFVDAFLDYWLDLRKAGDTTPDVTLYPDYYLDDLLLESSVNETRLFFAELLKNNLPARNLIQSDFTFVNSHLARHYGLAPVEGAVMRRVALPADSVRGGLLTQASVLKITANGTTTSPVLRGVWVLERILGDPPPPPPPGVPAVEPDTRGATTIRQQLDKHRAIPSCAGCHVKIDPPGFALENFDVFGAWRERYRSTDEGQPVPGLGKNGHDFAFRLGQPVDASGKLAGLGAFRDVIEMKRLLLKDERQIARSLARQFVTYATGAPVSFADRVEVERILDACQPEGYGVRTLVREIVKSDLFTHK
jgi:hypothetical protein